MAGKTVAILGIFVADLAFRARRQPAMGETIMGSGFNMGPGGKGSNQAVSAARAGATVNFISRLGKDTFGDIAVATWKAEGITPRVTRSEEDPTGAAYIFVSDETGDNAIIVVPGAAASLTAADVEAQREAIARCRRAGIRTVLGSHVTIRDAAGTKSGQVQEQRQKFIGPAPVRRPVEFVVDERAEQISLVALDVHLSIALSRMWRANSGSKTSGNISSRR